MTPPRKLVLSGRCILRLSFGSFGLADLVGFLCLLGYLLEVYTSEGEVRLRWA